MVRGRDSGATLFVDQAITRARPLVATQLLSSCWNAGESFSFVGADDKGTLSNEISIYVDDELNTKIHTSCSKPIGPGLISGDFIVIEGESLDGGQLCPLEVDEV